MNIFSWFKREQKIQQVDLAIESLDSILSNIYINETISLYAGDLMGHKLHADHSVRINMDKSDVLAEKTLKYIDKKLKKYNLEIGTLSGSTEYLELIIKRI